MTADAPVHGDADVAVRRELGRQFAVERLLHRGPLEAVYLARDAATRAALALTVIPRPPLPDRSSAQRFRRQSVLAARLDHPHILRVRGYGESPSFLWYSTDRYTGGPLQTGGAPMAVHECLRTVQQIASALDYACERGITHGDLRPANVLLDAQGWGRVAGFGTFCALGGVSALAALQWPPGVLDYLAPEQLVSGGPVGPAADQYALAVLTYECLAGKLPFDGAPIEDLMAGGRRTEAPDIRVVRPDVPPPVAAAVRRAMSDSPTQRFPGVRDFAAALVGSPAPRVLLPDEGDPDDDDALPPNPRRRRPWIVWVVSAALVVAAGVPWLAPTTPFPAQGAAKQDPAPLPPSPPAPAADLRSIPSVVPAEPPAPAQPEARPAPAPPPGNLVVNAMPWAELWVDGRSVGNTPIVSLRVSAGEHRLRLVRDGFEPYEQVVSVAPGETLRVTGIVLQEVQP